MIGSIALLYTFLATPSVAVDVRAPRIEIPDVRVEAPPFAAPDAILTGFTLLLAITG